MPTSDFISVNFVTFVNNVLFVCVRLSRFQMNYYYYSNFSSSEILSSTGIVHIHLWLLENCNTTPNSNVYRVQVAGNTYKYTVADHVSNITHSLLIIFI